MKSNLENLNFQTSIREQVVPSRKKVKLPAWLEVAKPRLIPLLLATTLGGMALTEEWPLSSPKLICTLGGGALAAAAAGALNCLWEMDLDKRMKRTSNRALPSGKLSFNTVFFRCSILYIGSCNAFDKWGKLFSCWFNIVGFM